MGHAERLIRTLNTVRFLRPRQIAYRVIRRVARVRPDLRPAPPRRSPASRVAFSEKETSILDGGRFDFLNVVRAVAPEEFGARKGELLWDYNFHYFDGLLGPSPGHDEKWEFVRTWCDRVPVGSRPAWDPYPVSRRILNWIKWSLLTGEGPEWFVQSLAVQVRYLTKQLEYHLLANHLFANAVALAAAASYFEGDEPRAWRQTAERLLTEELDEQFLADGAHFELSTVYHALLLEDLLDLIRITEAVGARPWPGVAETTSAALGWLQAMTRPDGQVPLLNDAAYGIAQTTGALEQYAAEVGVRTREPSAESLRLLKESGYFVYEHGRLHVIGDVGEPGPTYQPGHAHCDMLSFVLSWRARPVIVDTGTSTYEIGDRRAFERSTEAHNTVQLGTAQQSEIWAAFRMARRAGIEEVRPERMSIRARARVFPPHWSHHTREWSFDQESVTVVDRLDRGRGHDRATARFHLHPDVHVERTGGQWRVDGLRFHFDGADDVVEEPYDYAPEFNRRRRAVCLAVSFGTSLTTRITS